jgi:hypothetical protein
VFPKIFEVVVGSHTDMTTKGNPENTFPFGK